MRKWVLTFAGSCLLCVLGVLAALWALNGFHGLGLDLPLTIALVAGIVFTVALGVGLMALVFASDRAGRDDEAYKSTKR
jgi:cation transporter-like permease